MLNLFFLDKIIRREQSKVSFCVYITFSLVKCSRYSLYYTTKDSCTLRSSSLCCSIYGSTIYIALSILFV